MVLTLILIFASLGASLYLLLRKSRVEAFLDEFPGPPSFPLIGNIWILRKAEDRLTNLVNFQHKYGNRVALKGGSANMLVLYHPDDVAVRKLGEIFELTLIVEACLGQSEITEQYAKDEATAAIFAGHDTTSSAIIFTLYVLATHPEEQDKLHLELDEILVTTEPEMSNFQIFLNSSS
ncbi:unnamed protein product [Allacma fusca]|uniref:Cytochrome P450 n=1 Tax=Allacma fusca TaxID=39272 RepID=A0A8J2P4X4_9HEXA|nr:unnamed protein product [Allacma fusca]